MKAIRGMKASNNRDQEIWWIKQEQMWCMSMCLDCIQIAKSGFSSSMPTLSSMYYYNEYPRENVKEILEMVTPPCTAHGVTKDSYLRLSLGIYPRYDQYDFSNDKVIIRGTAPHIISIYYIPVNYFVDIFCEPDVFYYFSESRFRFQISLESSAADGSKHTNWHWTFCLFRHFAQPTHLVADLGKKLEGIANLHSTLSQMWRTRKGVRKKYLFESLLQELALVYKNICKVRLFSIYAWLTILLESWQACTCAAMIFNQIY